MATEQTDPLFDLLDFMRVDIGVPTLGSGALTIPVYNLAVFSGYPYYPKGHLFTHCHLVFKHVKTSKRIIYEYVENPKINLFHPERTVNDILFSLWPHSTWSYEFEGVSKTLNAYVVFQVEAEKFELIDQQ